MARKSKRSGSRRIARKKHQSRRLCGGDMLRGAPINYALAGNYASKMSLGQGEDYFKYHTGQHGGEAPYSSIGEAMLPSQMESSARTASLNQAFNEIKGMSDFSGGKRKHRRSHRHGRKRSHKRSHRRSHKRSNMRKHKGGVFLGAPVNTPGMYLDADGYSKAGLSPGWKNSVELTSAAIRNQL